MKTTRKTKTTRRARRNGKTTAARSLQDNAGMAMRRGRETLGRAYDWAHEAAGSSHLPHLRMPRRADLAHLSEANPLLLGAVGLGLGVAIGTLFPYGMRRAAPVRASRASNSGSAAKPTRRRRRKAARPAATSAG
ncbi:hypothetical protein [Taklimakanibacter lacteus]|uniref:hypothetical protein n=1 Tax=Taklimakanibacter lacteus TaxID=2268456 RepID=UPI0013C424DB